MKVPGCTLIGLRICNLVWLIVGMLIAGCEQQHTDAPQQEASPSPSLSAVPALNEMPPVDAQLSSDIVDPAQIFHQDLPDVVSAIFLPDALKTATSVITVDYPLPDALFPPDICAPTILWHDTASEAQYWLIDITFTGSPRRIQFLTEGKRPALVIDEEVNADDHAAYYETDYQKTGKAWTPSEAIWSEIKQNSVKNAARLSITGIAPGATGAPSALRILSKGEALIKTSPDPVGAPIFYRDVPLKPDQGMKGVIAPLSFKLFRKVQWRLRDISQPSAPVVMKDVSTCINCHSFSLDGKMMGADMDGPRGDKGSYFLAPVIPKMDVESEHLMSWNDFSELPPGERTLGLFARVSPDGRYAISMVSNDLFVANYMDFRFLQTFYPVRGIMGYFDRTTGKINRLPGADDPNCVQSNPFWTPDGKNIIFIKAKAVPAYGPGPMPTYANAPEEPPIQYDLYQIPFNDGKGGEAKPIEGASNNGKSNSMPAVSPDGKWLVYVQCNRGLLMRPDSKLFIVPAGGGKAREMRCNLPIMNSWHSWSPNSRWLVFSSKANRPFTQMFLTHVDENGNDTPPVLIPNSTTDNRAVNIPEFVNIAPDGIQDISVPAAEYRRHIENAIELRKQGQMDQAFTEVKQSLELRPDYPTTHVEMGWLLHKMGKTEEAISEFKRALELDNKNANALNNWGLVLLEMGQTKEAEEKFRASLALKPNYAPAENNLGLALRSMGKTSESLTHFLRAHELSPQDYTCINIASAFLRKNKPQEAINYCQQALALNPNASEAEQLWGDALLFDLNRPDEAASHYHKAIASAPNRKEAYLGLGIILTAQAQYDEALRHFAKAKELDPAYSEAYNRTGNVYLNNRQYERALQEYQHAHQLQPRDPFILPNMGIVLANLNRYPEAITCYTQSLEINPNYSSAHNYLGNALLAQGKIQESIAEYQRAIDTDPSNCYALDNMGLAFIKDGKTDKAISQFNLALRCAHETGNHPLANAIKQKLEAGVNPSAPNGN